MVRRRAVTMNWDGLGDVDDDDHFFETYERISSAVPLDLSSSSEEDGDFEDSRMSFASCVSSAQSFKASSVSNTGGAAVPAAFPEYDIWMAAPGSIRERRKRLLHGFGLDENIHSLQVTSYSVDQSIGKKFENGKANVNTNANSNLKPYSSPASSPVPATAATKDDKSVSKERKTESFRSRVEVVLSRSRSDGDIDFLSMGKARTEEFIGKISKQRLTRTSTNIVASRAKICKPCQDGSRAIGEGSCAAGQSQQSKEQLINSNSNSNSQWGAFFLIKNLDTGKEFIVNEYGEDGMWNRLSDLQTGKQLTREEFEKTVGHSDVVKELMRRENDGRHCHDGRERKLAVSKSISKSLRILSKGRGAAMLKSIKGKASGYFGESQKEREAMSASIGLTMPESKQVKNDWVRVRQSGKSHKELSALHMSQEIQAHEGCIWAIKFSSDGHYLASAGEDKVIHVWEVQECEVVPLRLEEGSVTPIHPSLLDRNGQPESPSLAYEKKKKKGKFGSKRGHMIPDYVHVPETVFSLFDKPFCSFQGHSDDVLNLSWSKSQLLLSSSMDKTVRLWDLESKTCLKLFAHSDFVTCVQFNPVDEDYFISGSLDAKVRIWNIPDRQVVDWVDVREMVTAVSYNPNAQLALVGTHKGTCRTYTIEDSQLGETNTIELRRKKKSHLRKVTGFQFVPGNTSQALVTSADSRIRLVDGSAVVQKFKGFRNGNSQIAASLSQDGRYIVSASEDSQVHMWKHEDHRHGSNGKGKSITVTQAHEYFPCKDVSAAIIWPCTIKGDLLPISSIHSKRQPKRIVSSPSQATSSCESPTHSYDDNTPKTISKPPLPKKNPNPSPEEDPAAISRTESWTRDSFASSSASIRYGDSPSVRNDGESPSVRSGGESPSVRNGGESPSIRSCGESPSVRNGGESPSRSSATNHPNSSMPFNWSILDNGQATTAWGLVIVTAGFGGEIKCYQNFGLPRRVRQGNIFGGPT